MPVLTLQSHCIKEKYQAQCMLCHLVVVGWIVQRSMNGLSIISWNMLPPLLLLLDGHSSHYNPEFIHFPPQKGVIVFALPPNTTHLSQPLDRVCFKALKQCWDEQCNLSMSDNPGKTITIYQFSELFAAAWKKAMTPQNITSSFCTTVVFL